MLVKESIARDIVRLIVWYPLRWLIAVLPVKCGFALFRLMGDIHYYLSGNKNNDVSRNLRYAFGEEVMNNGMVQDTLRNYFRNHYINQLQIFLFPRLNNNNVEQIHVFEGIENVNEALKLGKGCILLHAHFGPSQLPLCDLGIKGYEMMQIGLPTDEGLSFIGKKVAFRLRLKYESKIPARIIPADTFLRPVFDWLRNNKVLMITGDGAGGKKFIGRFKAVPFLGKQVLFPVGISSLVQKTMAPVLPMFTVIDSDHKYRSIIHKPIMTDTANNNDSYYITSEFAKLMEKYINNFPYLWHFWDEFKDRVTANRDSEL